MGEAENKKSKALYGIGFLLSVGLMVALLMIYPGIFWISLPFVFTCGVRYMDII
ncbi:MAG: hypothetical protein WCI97_12740 [Bacteroidota bacterium]